MADGDIVAGGPTAQLATSSPAYAPQLAKVFAPVPVITVADLAGVLSDLAEAGAAVLVATHDVEFAAQASTRMLLMADGDGQLYVYGVGDRYADRPIDAFWRTPWQALGGGARGRFGHLNMFASGTMDITLTTDSCRLTRRVRLGERMRPATVPLGGHGARFTLTIRNVNGGRF